MNDLIKSKFLPPTNLKEILKRELAKNPFSPWLHRAYRFIANAIVRPKYYLSVCAIFKDEAPNLKEWIEFHRLVGVEKFYLYNNNSQDDYNEVLAPYIAANIVTLIEWPESPGQVPAYRHCIQKFKYYSQWIAFIDIDEFLFGTEEDSLPEILKYYEGFPGVMVNWLMFGSSGYQTRPEGLITEKFTWRMDINRSENKETTWATKDSRLGGHVTKSIVNPREVRDVEDPHKFRFFHYALPVDEQYRKGETSRTDSVNVDVLRINHYFLKGREDGIFRIKRGSATGRTINPRQFRENDRNQIEDTTIHRFIDSLKPRMAKPEKASECKTLSVQTRARPSKLLRNAIKSVRKLFSPFEAVHGKHTVTEGKENVVTIISCFNQWEYSSRAVESYLSSKDDSFNYTLMIMDDLSSDRTRHYFTKKLIEGPQNHYYFRYKRNVGVTRTWNDGIKFALKKLKADYVFLVNSDVLFSEDSLKKLVHHFKENQKLGMVGPLTNSPGNQPKQNIRNYLNTYSTCDDLTQIQADAKKLEKSSPVSVEYLNGFFMGLTKRSLLESRKWFGLQRAFFKPGLKNLYSDREIQSRMSKAGFQIAMCPDVFVFHYKDVSQGKRNPNHFQSAFRRPKTKTCLSIDLKSLNDLKHASPIIVTGMHRSGTSILTRMLRCCGVYMGDDEEINSESRFFQRVNQKILSRSNAKWSRIGSYVAANRGVRFWPREERFVRDHYFYEKGYDLIGLTLADYLGEKVSLFDLSRPYFYWGFKDPRNTLTFPIWLRIFPNARILNIVRNGEDVARSLSKRTSKEIEKGFCSGPKTKDPQYSYALWENYLNFFDSHKHIIPKGKLQEIRYETLLEQPSELYSILRNWGIPVTNQDFQSAAALVRRPPPVPTHSHKMTACPPPSDTGVDSGTKRSHSSSFDARPSSP